MFWITVAFFSSYRDLAASGHRYRSGGKTRVVETRKCGNCRERGHPRSKLFFAPEIRAE